MAYEIISKIEKIFGVETVNDANYIKALTHPSYINNGEVGYNDCYERLEFLGDAVLKLAVSNILYEKYPNYNEGQMSKIRSIVVSDSILAKISNRIGLSELIIAGEHDIKQGIRKLESVNACAFEAILGAYFLDGKFYKISAVLAEWLKEYIVEVDNNFEKYNAKAILQEYTQSLTKETPKYDIVSSSGKEHNKIFVAEVSYRGEVIAKGEGKTKKDAEQNAAYDACIKLGAVNHE